jgi:pyridoxine 5-phosphate synthase
VEPFLSYKACDYEDALSQYRSVADAAAACELGVNAGHDLTLDNPPAFKAAVPMLTEVSIAL